jgi:branched-chain amino acid transport system substrate-binding protein
VAARKFTAAQKSSGLHVATGPLRITAGWLFAQPLVYVLTQCSSDLSRENIMRQAANLKNVQLPGLLPGITLNTSSTDYQPIKKLREMQFNGKTWDLIEEPNDN